MYDSKTKNFLQKFGVGNTYRGFQYCAYSVKLAAEAPDRLNSITKCIYPDVAKKFKTTSKCVERDIRTVAEVVWANGGEEFFRRTNGELFIKRPPNSKFLEILADYITLEEMAGGPCHDCKIVADFKEQIKRLEEEIKRLEDMVQWMHDLIWKLIKESRHIM